MPWQLTRWPWPGRNRGGRRTQRTHTPTDLHKELRYLGIYRVLWVIAVSLQSVAVAAWLLRPSFTPDSEWVATRCVAMAALAFGAVLVTIGSAGLIRAVRDVQTSPTPECISSLVASMSYVGARREAWGKLAALAPLLTREQATSVDAGVWRRLYRRATTAPPQHTHVAFEIAALLKDRCAIPYLGRLLASGEIPPDTRTRCEAVLRTLSEDSR